jgi:peptidoglycan/xylan/chitin deacetylase (PgdA/CDA1 family)
VSESPGHDIETVAPAAFEAQMAWLAANGLSGVSVSELLSLATVRPRRCVALSFDDGYRDNAEVVGPVLQRYGFRATIYVATAGIGGVSFWNRREYIGHRSMLGTGDIVSLARQGIEFGSHGHAHLDMTQLDEQEIDLELQRSHEALAAILGKRVRGFACPFGRWNARLRERVIGAGFHHMVLGGRFSLNSAVCDPYGLARITIARGDSLREFAKKATGAYRWLAFRDRA